MNPLESLTISLKVREKWLEQDERGNPPFENCHKTRLEEVRYMLKVVEETKKTVTNYQ